jgi:lysophospholipase L1-like esterase
MKTEKTENRRISTKAKVIFFTIPLLILVLMEIVARLILPAGFSQADQDSELIDRYRQPNPPLLARPLSDKSDSEALLAKSRKMSRQVLPNKPFHESDDLLFYRLKRNFSISFMPNPGLIINYSTNSLGFRGDEFSAKKPEGKVRIICTGDSSTFGCSVNLIQTYSARLGHMLSKKTREKNSEVINAGVLGYSSYQGLKYFETVLRDLRPDILIASWGYNDARKAPAPDSEVDSMTVRSLGFSSKLNNLALYRLIDKIISGTKEATGSTTPLVPKVSVDKFGNNLDKLVSYCKEDGIHLIFLPITSPFPYFNTMKDIAANNRDVGFIDMEKIFADHYDRFLEEGATYYKGIRMSNIYKRHFESAQIETYGSPEMARIREWSYLFMDVCHPTPVGYYIIAESIYEYLIEHGFFTKAEGESPTPSGSSPLILEPLSIPEVVN